jgi:hypothetical protein
VNGERLGLLYGGHSLAAYLCRRTHAFRAAVVVEFNLHQSSRAERPSKDLLLRSCKEAKVLDFRGSGRVARSGKEIGRASSTPRNELAESAGLQKRRKYLFLSDGTFCFDLHDVRSLAHLVVG